jgi:hypothetical protein
MAAIVTGTVVRWKVVGANTVNERVKHVSDKEVSVYVGDGSEEDDVSAILAKYILDEVGDAPAQGEVPANVLATARELLIAARNGLVRVSGIKRATVTPPPAP